jgi:hypothetical protein
VDPDDEILESTAIVNLVDFRAAAIGVYATVPANGGVSWNSWFTDELQLPASNTGQGIQVHNWAIVSDDGTAGGLYSSYYTVINRANRVLRAADGVNLEEGEQAEFDKILGEMYALRAWCHFKELTYFSTSYTDSDALAVPYIDFVVVTEKPSRNTVGEVFSAIESDLSLAKGLIPSSFTDNIFFTLDAITALESRMALYREDFALAITKSSSLISNYNLTNASSYANIWTDSDESENIFNLARVIGDAAVGQIYNANSELILWLASDKLYNSFSAGDVRLDLIDETTRVINKYPGSAAQIGLNNIKEFRIAEQYLIRSEAYARSAQLSLAADDYNALRSNRIANYEPEVFANGSAALDNILEERYRELAFEGHRFLDLKRTGNDVVRDDSDCSFLAANNACTLQNSNYLFTLPIPQSEIFVNPSLIQNPGY